MGILVCLLENAFASLFSLNNTDDELAVYTADQLSYAHNQIIHVYQRCMCIYVILITYNFINFN